MNKATESAHRFDGLCDRIRRNRVTKSREPRPHESADRGGSQSGEETKEKHEEAIVAPRAGPP
jgi:hypothetical protein